MSLRPMSEAEKIDLEVGRMMRKVAGDPKHRRNLYNTLKQADPRVRWPDMEMQDLREELARERESNRIQQDVRTEQQRMDSQRKDVLAKFGEKGLEDIEKLMLKHKILDYEVASKLYAADAPEVQGREEGPASNYWSMPTDKDLLDNPNRWANERAHAMIKEFKTARGIPSR
jgi:hypothetical protein